MHTSYRSPPFARYNSFHGPKQRVLGNQAGQVPPAWRVPGPSTAAASKGKQAASGSKILLSQLPLDVRENEVEELFKKTVGPLKESFIIYNSQGRSKGMAVVVFQRSGDAAVARTKYDGKYVDGRRPIKIEVITDSTNTNIPTAPTPTAPPSLFDRIQGKSAATSAPEKETDVRVQNHNLPRQVTAAAAIVTSTSVAGASNLVPPRRRQKKGPKRLKKQGVQFARFTSKTREELDKEMEDYRAAADQV